MKVDYTGKVLAPSSLKIVASANAIADEYAAQGYDLTLRQLFYQFVSRDLLANRVTEYKRLVFVINDARLAGYMDWDHIVDRTRNLRDLSHWDDPAQLVRAAARQYREDKWAAQDTYVEVWIEKDALVGVLEAVCPANDVPYFSCRGYTSQSEVWGAAQRLREHLEKDQNVVVIHLGDHDPSGIDMSRDIEHRLAMFLAQDHFGMDPGLPIDDYLGEMHGHLTVDRIALNMDQVRQYNPPPNPAKLSDARAQKYVRLHGDSSWELDALDPATLVRLIQGAIDNWKDDDVWHESVEREEAKREVLTAASDRWPEVCEFLDTFEGGSEGGDTDA